MSVVYKETQSIGPGSRHPSSQGLSFSLEFNEETNAAGTRIIDKSGLRLGSVSFDAFATAVAMTFKVGIKKPEQDFPDLADMKTVTGLSVNLTAEGTFKLDDLAEWDFFLPILDNIGTGEIETVRFAFR